MSDYKPTIRHNGSPDAIAFVKAVNAEAERSAAAKEAWIQKLRAQGVKMARPDDGWVDRENDVIRGPHCYADFDDGVKVGDMVALGRPESYRLVRIIQIQPWGLFRDRFEWAYERVE